MAVVMLDKDTERPLEMATVTFSNPRHSARAVDDAIAFAFGAPNRAASRTVPGEQGVSYPARIELEVRRSATRDVNAGTLDAASSARVLRPSSLERAV